MKQIKMMIQNPTGLHARPAKVFVDIAKGYQSDIIVFCGEKKANAKSLISMLTLGVESGSEITIQVLGQDEVEAIRALEGAVEDGLGENEILRESAIVADQEIQESPDIKENLSSMPDTLQMKRLLGVAGAPGIAIGPIHHFKRAGIEIETTFESESEEKNKLQVAIEQAKAQLKRLRKDVLVKKAASEAAIFEVHLEFLEDADLLDEVLDKINQKQNAALAWQTTIDARARLVASLKDPLLAARSADLHDVGYRVLRILVGANDSGSEAPGEPVVIVAEDLSPSETAAFDSALVLGFCIAHGGPTSHTAIIARALGLPAIVNAGEAILSLKEATPVILNGGIGELVIDPSDSEIANAVQKQQEENRVGLLEKEDALAPAITRDRHIVEVAANIGCVQDAYNAKELGADAVGLLRTEFLFMDRDYPPSEEEQTRVYREIGHALGEKPVVVRTMDIGGDKPLPYFQMMEEANPFLGERGIRLCLKEPHLLREQIKAILRAESNGSFRMMFPMVSNLTEWHSIKAIVHSVELELGISGIDTGIMVEVPSAALLADVFAKHVDFFSIGTNDLTQYTLAMDRLHPQLAEKLDGLHPAVLRLIDMTVRAAHKQGKWVGVCGELGADPQAIPILVGLGIDELSVNVPAIPKVKAQIRRLNFVEAQSLAQSALQSETAEAVRKL